MDMTAHMPPPAGADHVFAPGKLLPGVHSRLVMELDRFAEEAGISVADITGANYHLTDVEKQYLRGFRRAHRSGKAGLIYVGQHDPSVLNRCRSVAGALIRNFITVRMVPREVLIDRLFNGGPLAADCVIVPNFHYEGAPVATRRALASWITERLARGHQTVLGVPSRKALSDVFAEDAQAYLDHFHVVKGFEG